MALKPGDLIKIKHRVGGREEEAQVVWIGSLSILRNGQVEDFEVMCVFVIERGVFKTLQIKHTYTNFGERYFYEKEYIGGDGL